MISQPLDAIDDIHIDYMVGDTARHVFTNECFTVYNDVFRFILKLKWSLWMLESMRFPKIFRKPIPYKPLTIHDLLFKRLAMIRNWIFYSIQSIYSHYMVFVVQATTHKFAKQLKNITCLQDLIKLHESYVNIIHGYCFRKASDADLCEGVYELCRLTSVLSNEWQNLDTMQYETDEVDASTIVKQIDVVESTFIDCHTYIAKKLSKEVFSNNRTECELFLI